jgi:RND family efflux transporter MFP subunit
MLLVAVAGGVTGGKRYLRGEAGQQWVRRILAPGGEATDAALLVPTTQVARGMLEITLTVVGILKAKESVPIAAETSGIIVGIAADGQRVKKGDVVVQLQSNELRLQIDEKRVAYENAKSKREDTKRDRTLEAENARNQLARGLEELAILKDTDQAALAKAQAALEFKGTELSLAKVQLARMARLAEEKLVRSAEVEKGREAVAAGEFAVSQAEAELKLQRNELASKESQKQAEVDRLRFAADLAGRRIADETKNAQTNVDTVKKQWEDLEDQLKKSVVRAPSDGAVLLTQRWVGNMRTIRPGDLASPRQKLLELPDLSQMVLECEIQEKDIGLVRRGQEVRVTLDPYPDFVCPATVKEIATVAKPASLEGGGFVPARNTFTTVIQITKPDAQRLRPGMNATAQILASTEKDVVYISVDALFERQGHPFVYRLRGKHFVPTPVKTGRRNKDNVIITQGLKPGDALALVVPPEEVIAR